MALQEKDLRLLAKFFYKHRNDEAYWTSPLLLQHPETQSFGLSIGVAESVFEAFEKKGFLRKDGTNKLRIGEVDFQMYRFDLAGLKDFREYADIPFYHKWFSERILDRIGKFGTLLLICFVLIATSFLQSFVGKWGEWFYDKINPKIEEANKAVDIND
jgi:hypothetical protein